MRRLPVAALAAAALALIPLQVWGVSDGDYSYQQQGCSGGADDNNRPGAEQGCHNSRIVISDGDGNQIGSAGTDQSAQGQPVQNGDATLTPQNADLTSGARLYFGADDNLDTGEHDASPQWQQGPSDGGGLHLNATPALVEQWLAHAEAADIPWLLTHPTPLDAGFGGCADGTCASVQTQRQVAFQGGTSGGRDAANYSGMQWDPYNCSSESQQTSSPQACGGHPLRWWNDQQGSVYVEPGAQVYEDPDAQGSPAIPGVYPIPSVYAGTCGVVAGGGNVGGIQPPQESVSTGC